MLIIWIFLLDTHRLNNSLWMENMLTVHLADNRGKSESVHEELELAALYLGHNIVRTQFGVVRQHDFSDSRRHCVYVLPDVINAETSILMYYHGSRGNAWISALYETRWIEYCNSRNMIVVFGQAEGEIADPHIHEHYGYVSYGERYWEIRDNFPQFDRDLQYTKDIIKHFTSTIPFQEPKVYYCGYSNGGVILCLFAIRLAHLFTAMVSHMGGIGYDACFYLDFSLNDALIPPLLFYTGEFDIHRKPCETARKIFLCANTTIVDIHIEPGLDHSYRSNCEQFIIQWIDNLPIRL